jgi:prealbumin domain-containing protein
MRMQHGHKRKESSLMFLETPHFTRQDVLVILFVSLLCSSSLACSLFTLSTAVPTSFVIQASDFRGHPLKSTQFQLMQGTTMVNSFVTDGEGHIFVKGLPAGKYTLKRNDLDPSLLVVNLDVSDSNEAHKTPLSLRWPRGHVYTRSLAGTLHFFKTEPEPRPVQSGDTPLIEPPWKITKGAVAGVHLELFQAGVSQKIAEITTAENGDFDFQVTKPGLYEVRFRFNNEERSKILELDSDSTSESNLDLWVSGGFVANGFRNALRGCD